MIVGTLADLALLSTAIFALVLPPIPNLWWQRAWVRTFFTNVSLRRLLQCSCSALALRTVLDLPLGHCATRCWPS